jgi:hypothetical protein
MCVCVRVCMSYTINLTLQYTPATALATDAARVARLHGSGAGASGSRPSARACSSRARCSQVGPVTDAQPVHRSGEASAHGTRHTHGTHTHTHTYTCAAHKRNRDAGPRDLTNTQTHSHNASTSNLGKGRVGLVVTRRPFDVGLHTPRVSSAQRRVGSTAYRHAHTERLRLPLVVNGNFGRFRV